MPLLLITSYFNPFGFEAKERNYYTFRENLPATGVSVLCVEQVYEGVPRVGNSDDIAIQGGDLLWQKEALLQIGIDHALKSGEKNILLCDCDIVFTRPDAFEQIEASFSKFDFFQPYETVCLRYYDCEVRTISLFSCIERGLTFDLGHPGSAWAASAEFLRSVRIYPFGWLGGGDNVLSYLLGAANRYGLNSDRFRALLRYILDFRLYPELESSILCWLEASLPRSWRLGFTSAVALTALPHGKYGNRNYESRYSHWQTSSAMRGPTPDRDLKIGRDGLLQWTASENPWRCWAAAYLKGRNEDGEKLAACGEGEIMGDKPDQS
jgi:hypothetical protein